MKGKHWYNRRRVTCIKTIEVTQTYRMLVCCVWLWNFWFHKRQGISWLSCGATAQCRPGPLILVDSRSHKTTYRSRQDSSGHVIGLSQRPLPDDTQHSQQIAIHVPDAIRTCSLSSHAAAKLRLRPRSHWDQHFLTYWGISVSKGRTLFNGVN